MPHPATPLLPFLLLTTNKKKKAISPPLCLRGQRLLILPALQLLLRSQIDKMATSSSEPEKKKNASFPNPPRRGQVKVQIFNGLVKSVVSTVSKAGESLGKLTGKGGSGGGRSASSTPPRSAYNSEGNSDVS